MASHIRTLLAVVGAAALVVLGLETYAYAATGDSLLIGEANQADEPTHLTNTVSGPALSLHAKGSQPALAVNSTAKVALLNADAVDGKDATALQHTVRIYTAAVGSAPDGVLELALPNDIPKGLYQIGYQVRMMGANGLNQDPTDASCRVINGSKIVAYESASLHGWNQIGISANDIINVDGAPLSLYCHAAHSKPPYADDWSISPSSPIRVTLTRIETAINGSLTIVE